MFIQRLRDVYERFPSAVRSHTSNELKERNEPSPDDERPESRKKTVFILSMG